MLWGIALLLITANYGTTASAQGDGLVPSGGLRRGGFMVHLQQREHPTRRRHLLRNGALGVEGSVREVGYFYTTLKLGTPAREFSVIIDTGSTITYIPCKGCAHCGKHKDEWFDPDESETAKKLGCQDPLCNCGSPSCTCNNDRCYYSRTYAERSSSEGWMIEDAFGFPDDQPPVRMVFGCENGETGEIYRQMADGIMGMGNNHNAFQSQLVRNGVIDDVFSLCFGYPRNGILLLGDVPLPAGAKTVYTPLLNNLHLHYYNIKMEGIEVDGERLPLDQGIFNRGYGVVLDSGTTFTYLPSDAFKSMSQAIKKYAEAHGLQPTPGADPQYNDICWKGAPNSFDELHKVFPPATFVLGDDAHLKLPPVRYLFLSRPGEYCLGIFDNGMSGTLIGGVSVRDVVITYDRQKNRVGFTSMPCEDVAADIAKRPQDADNVTIISPSPPPPKARPPPPTPPPPRPPPPTPPPPFPPPPKKSPPPPSPPPSSPPPPVSPSPSSPKPSPSPSPSPSSSSRGSKHHRSPPPAQTLPKASPSPPTMPNNASPAPPINTIDTKSSASSASSSTPAGGRSAVHVTQVTTLPGVSSGSSGVSYKQTQAVAPQNSIDYRLVFAVVLAIGGMFVVAELVFFRKTVLVTWWGKLAQAVRGAGLQSQQQQRDDAERQPLQATGKVAMGP